MNNLVQILDNKVTTTSLQVAKHFNKDHSKVLRQIRSIVDEDTQANFGLSEYIDESGKRNNCYIIDRDGFVLLAMGFTGKKAMQFKKDYIKAFNQMQAQLANPVQELTRKQILTLALEAEEKVEQLEKEVKAKDKVIEDQNKLHNSMLTMKATQTRTALKALKDDIGVEINTYVNRLYPELSYRERHIKCHKEYAHSTGMIYGGASKASLESKIAYLQFLKEKANDDDLIILS